MQPPEPEAIRDLFARHNIRCTKQREDIYSVLCASDHHPTADELCREVRQIQPGLSLATVYNTLEKFTEHGLCRRLGMTGGANGACRYDADLEHHVHIIGADGAVSDLDDSLAEELMAQISPETLRRIEARLGMPIERVSIDLIAKPQPKARRDEDDDAAA